MLILDESIKLHEKSTSQNFHKRVLYDRKVTLKKLMWPQVLLRTGAMKVSEKNELNIKLCLAPFTSRFVLGLYWVELYTTLCKALAMWDSFHRSFY